MPTPPRLRNGENPSTYFVQDRRNPKELVRLTIQDQMITVAMGGVLSEQADSTAFRHVLDIACGTGGWLIELAQIYPEMSLVGIDISQRMIKYARNQAEAHQVHERIEFFVMDALRPLDFSAATFDLINLRLGISFLRTWEWPKLLAELLRTTCPSGIIRVTDTELIPHSNSPALIQLFNMERSALYRAGHLFTEDTGLISHLVLLLQQCGCEQVQTKAYAMECQAGMPEGKVFYEDIKLFFQTTRPFIQKWGGATKDYDAVYRQALDEICQPDFYAKWSMFTAWGSKPGLQSENSQSNNLC
jgi:ubiquinone/menaquinone biosynthesis C-methylase UbiE